MEEKQLMMVLGSLLLGGVLAFFGYYLTTGGKRRRLHAEAKLRTESDGKHVTDSDEKKPGDQREVSGQSASGGGSSKRQAKSKKRREAQQEFSHSWMVGALKGHTAPILDMDFSANGKFLASCAEDCGLLPKEELDNSGAVSAVATAPTAGSPSTSTGSKADPRISSAARSKSSSSSKTTAAAASSTAAAAAPPSPSSSTKSTSSSGSSAKEEQHHHQQHRAILSRRQRKNRTRAPRRELRERDDDHEDDHNGPPPQPATSAGRHRDAAAAKAKAAEADKHHHHHHHQAKPAKDSCQKKSAESKGNAASGADGKKSKSNHLSADSPRYQHAIAHPQLHQLSEAAIATLLRRYTLTGDQLAHLGYPVEFSHFPGYAIVVNYQHHQLSWRYHHRHGHHHHHHHSHQHHLDVNAREFVPAAGAGSDSAEVDSGTGSAGSSLESSDLEQESSSDSDKSSDIGESQSSSSSSNASSSSTEADQSEQERLQHVIERRCARCSKNFYVRRVDGEYMQEEKCVYHWGKLRSSITGESWECCRGRESSRGCTTARAHVWTGIVPGCNGPFHDYARTRPARHIPHDGNYGVYALDCEMCFTKRGLELGKVSVVALDGKIVYEALVKPDAEVIDYNTRFSGLRARDLVRATKSLRDVQKDITSFVHAETILIGHGLENDLRALRILHPTVIDTCMAFPHFLGYPFRSSLKTLARTVLRKEIQVKEHDSAEDARIAVDLMLKRLQHDFF